MKVLVTNTAALNTGDAAILFATLDILRRAFGDRCEFVIHDQQAAVAHRYYPEFSFRPLLYDQATAEGGAIHCYWRLLRILAVAFLWRLPLGRFAAWILPRPLRERLPEMASVDLVVSAGGTYFVPYYRTFSKLFELLVADALGRPFVLFTQSLGPFSTREQRLLRYILRRARLILVRDDKSRRHLMQVGVRSDRVIECADAAFALMPRPLSDGSVRAKTSLPLSVAISVRDWPHFEGDISQRMDKYLGAVAALAGWLIEERDAKVTFLSTCQGISEYWTDDGRIAEAVAARLPEPTRPRTTIDREFHAPAALMRKLGEFDLVVATRMHVAILALCAGVPVLPIAYEFKSVELFKNFGLGDLVQEIDKIDGEALRATAERMLEIQPRIRAELPRRVAQARQSAFSAGDHIKRALAFAS